MSDIRTMTAEGINISPAQAFDLDEILALLTTVNLPCEGVAEHLENFLVARDERGHIVATIGMERHGSVGLIRSAAVSPSIQRSGLGSHLTAQLLSRAETQGVDEVVLLTTTARDFFARRFGFLEAKRTAYEEKLSGSPEWNLPRCSSAAFMTLSLKRCERALDRNKLSCSRESPLQFIATHSG